MDQTNLPLRGRLRPRTPAAWVTAMLATAFVILWLIFAVRAVDRNNALPPTPTLPAPTATPNLQATVDSVNRRLFPDGSDTTPIASPAASPIGTPIVSAAATP